MPIETTFLLRRKYVYIYERKKYIMNLCPIKYSFYYILFCCGQITNNQLVDFYHTTITYY